MESADLVFFEATGFEALEPRGLRLVTVCPIGPVVAVRCGAMPVPRAIGVRH